LGVLAAFCWIWPSTSAAVDEAADSIPKVSLDDLLQLPKSFEVETSRRGGRTRAEWHARFLSAKADVAESQAALDEALAEMEELAEQSSNWKIASPFKNAEANTGENKNAPLNYGMKQDIRRKRLDVERAERALLDLGLQANLAGVPEAWYSPGDYR
jgi:hypothetical protein